MKASFEIHETGMWHKSAGVNQSVKEIKHVVGIDLWTIPKSM